MNVAKLFTHDRDTTALAQAEAAGATLSRTCRKFNNQVARISAALGSLGADPGRRVLILSGTRVETLEAIVATFSRGAVAMPLSRQLGTQNIELIIRKTQPAVCLHEEALEPSVQAALRDCGARMLSLAALAVLPDAALQHATLEEDALALMIHTSGSEGSPKEIRMTHGALRIFLAHNAILHDQFTAAGEDPGPILSVLPLSHLGGLGLCLHGLMTGRATTLMSVFVPGAYLRALASTRCRMMVLVPAMYRSLMKDRELPQTNLSAVKFCMTLGEPCTEEFAARLEAHFGKPVSAYGLTECLTGLGHLREDLFGGGMKHGSCGRLCFGEVKLADRDGVEHATLGELWVRNPTVRACYADETLNRARIEAGWFRTGDLFFRDADGHFFHRGRCDDMFICRGKNIYPAELERLLMTHPAVEMVCAAPIMAGSQGALPAVLIQRKGAASESQIMDFIAHHGLTHAVPRVVLFAEQLPSTGPGKIDRRAAAKLLQAAFDHTSAAL